MNKIRISFGGELIKKIFLVFLTLLLSISPMHSALAIDQEDLQMYSQNNILFYDPSECESYSQDCVPPTGDQITWIGDSYSTGAHDIIEDKLPGVDFGSSIDDANSFIQSCKFVGRDTSCNANPTNPAGLDILQKIINNNQLRPYLVFALGGNGGWSENDIDRFKNIIAAAPDTKVVFTTIQNPNDNYATTNNLLKDLAQSSDNYSLADWTKVYDPNYFTADSERIHPSTNGGYEKWVDTIIEALPQDCAEDVILPGANTEEKIWNWLVNYLNTQNLSSKNIPAIVAGIMSNYSVESSYKSLLEGKWSSQDQNIEENLSSLTSSADWQNFLTSIKSQESVTSASDYSDIFSTTIPKFSNINRDSIHQVANDLYNKYSTATSINPTITTGAAAVNSASNTPTGDGKNYAGEVVWNEEQMAKVNEYKTVYESAAQQYGLPWQLLATMHRLEHGQSITNPGNGQGIYQLYSYTNGGTNSNSFPPTSEPVSMAEFQRQTNIAAEIMKGMIEAGGYDPDSDEGVKFLIFSYNGRASQYKQKALAMGFSQEEAEIGEGSPYVMNRFDARRDPNSPSMDANWPGRFVADGVYDPSSTMWDFGGFILYTALGGGHGSSSNACELPQTNYGDLISYVKQYAWPGYNDAPMSTPTDAYAEVARRWSSEGKYVGCSDDGPAEDCGAFVTILLVESGFDPEYNGGGIYKNGASNISGDQSSTGQLAYVKNSDKWELVNPDWNTPISDESVLSPGDVAFENCNSQSDCGHTYVYIGEVEGFETHIASASCNDRFPRSGHEGIINGRGIVRWYHKVR